MNTISEMNTQYLLTERAHLMCPNMCFGVTVTLNAHYDSDRLRQTIDKLETAHPFLNAVIGFESVTNRYFYKIGNKGMITLKECGKTEVKTIAAQMLNDYDEIVKHDFDLLNEGMLKINSYNNNGNISLLFVLHHLLADGRGGFGLVQEFADKYVSNVDPSFAQERLISSMNDLPKGSRLPFISSVLIKRCNKQWLSENHMVSYGEYHEFANNYVASDQIKHVVTTYEPTTLEEIVQKCRDAKVSVNDYLMAQMYVNDSTEKIIIACDIREQLSCYHKGALGNYSTAKGIICKTQKKDIMEIAQIVHSKVKKTLSDRKKLMQVLSCYIDMDLGLIDAAAISVLGKFESKAGYFVGSAMFGFKEQNGFSITNLGKVDSDHIKEAMFIPPASPAVKKIVGVLTVNGKMVKCTNERV